MRRSLVIHSCIQATSHCLVTLHCLWDWIKYVNTLPLLYSSFKGELVHQAMHLSNPEFSGQLRLASLCLVTYSFQDHDYLPMGRIIPLLYDMSWDVLHAQLAHITSCFFYHYQRRLDDWSNYPRDLGRHVIARGSAEDRKFMWKA